MSSEGQKRRSMRNQPRLYEHHNKALATINDLYIETGTDRPSPLDDRGQPEFGKRGVSCA